MIYRKKIRFLSATALFLALVFAGTFFFDSQRREEKRSDHVWINRELLEKADRIEIYGMSGPVILERINNVWVMPVFMGEEGPVSFRDFPVKKPRVDDLFSALSRRMKYPLRSRYNSSLEQLGLLEGQASRIIVRGGAGLPLLNLLIGFGDAAGSTVYLRKAGSAETRSGEDVFSVFTETGRKSWLDFSLFGNGQSAPSVSLDMIQQVLVYPPGQNGSCLISRSGRDWSFLRSNANGENFSIQVDRLKTESWLRSILNAEADDFDYFLDGGRAVFDKGSIILELEDGTSRILRVGPEDENKNRPAVISGTGSAAEFVYTLTGATLKRLFPGEGYFTGANAGL